MNYWDIKPEAEFEFAYIVIVSIAFCVGYGIGELTKKIGKETRHGAQKPDRS